jgi:hypothetical protein
MIRRFGVPVAAFAVLVAAGCAGGGVTAPSPHVAATPNATTTAAGIAGTSATLRIVIPARPAASASTTRSPKYISFATQSIEIVLTPSGGGSAITVTQNLTPTSPGCQGNLNSSTTCTLHLPGLVPGTYAVSFTTFDGTLDSNNVPTGNVLSANQNVPETIRAGQDNVLAVTLNGVPSAVAVLPSLNSTLTGSQHAGYTLSACFASEPAGTEGITVVGLDADGNIIVGAGAPAPSLGSSDTSKATISTPSTSAPNLFALSGPATPATPGTSFTLSAAVTPLAGSPNTTPISAGILVTLVAGGCPTPSPAPTATPSPTPAPQAATTVQLASSVNPSVSGQSVTFTASIAVVAPGTGSPTGTVTFKDNGTAIGTCSAQAVSSSAASCTIGSLSPGTHPITAVYNGDASFSGSTSNTVSEVVNAASTVTSVTSSVGQSVTGQSVTYTATITVVSPGSGSPTGAVAFKDGATVISGCSTQAVSSGSASCTVSTLSTGPHSITAVYSGDASFTTSTSGPVSHPVSAAVTATALSADVNPSVTGQSVTFEADLTVTPPGSGSPTGAVAFKDGGTTISTCSSQAVSNSSATCTISTLSAGSHTITAAYSGDVNFGGSTSNSVVELVTKATPTVTITASQPGGVGANVQFGISVAGSAISPSGTVNVARQSTPATTIASCVLSGTGGTATCTTSASVGPGTTVFVANYVGDGSYNSASGTSNSLTVQSVRAQPR